MKVWKRHLAECFPIDLLWSIINFFSLKYKIAKQLKSECCFLFLNNWTNIPHWIYENKVILYRC